MVAKPWAMQFYSSKAWQQCRESYIARRIAVDGGLCERCHERLGEIVHHTKWLTPRNITDPSIALDHRRLQLVCHECHDDIHLHKRSNPRLTFDAEGNVVKRDEKGNFGPKPQNSR